MKTWARAAVAIGLLAAGGGRVWAAPTVKGAMQDDDGTIFLPDDDDSQATIHEWRADGHYERLAAPFGPFTKRDPRMPDQLLEMWRILGHVGIVAEETILYRRQQDGRLGPVPFFAQDGGDIPCDAPVGTGGCLFGRGKADDSGRTYDVIYKFADLMHPEVLVEDGGKVRAVQGAELKLTSTDFIDSDAKGHMLRDPATGALMVFPDFSNQEIGYDLLTSEGRVRHKVDMGDTFNFVINFRAFARGGTVYVGATLYKFDAEGGVPMVMRLVAIKDAFSDAPVSVPMLAEPSAIGGNLTSFAADDQAIYFVKNGEIAMSVFSDGAVTMLGEPCAGTSAGFVEGNTASGSIFALCGTKLVELAHGAVVRSMSTGKNLSNGTLVNDSEHAVVLVQGAAGVMKVIDGVVTELPPAIKAPADPTASLSWEEGGRTCGMALDGADQHYKVYCRNGLDWALAADHPPLDEVTRYPSGLWGLKTEGSLLIVYRFDGTAWQEAARTELELPAGVGVPAAHFIASEGFADVVAIDPPTRNFVLRLQNGNLVKTNPGAHGERQPLLAMDGRLFARVDDKMVLIGADGAMTTLPGEALSGKLVPLKRGVMLWAEGDSVVYRGEHAIKLTSLYGELHSLPEHTVRLRGKSLFGRGFMLQATLSSGNRKAADGSRYYLFDGSTLTAYDERSVAAARLGGSDADSAATTTVPGSPTPGGAVDYSPQNYVHQTVRGFFQDGEGFGTRVSHELAAAFGGRSGNLNRINGLALRGENLFFATEAGVVQCAAAAGAELNGAADFGSAKGCGIVRGEGPVSAMARAGAVIVVAEGGSVSLLGGETRSQGRASGLAGDGDDAVWIEDGARLARLRADGSVDRSDLPAGVTKASARYACAAGGVNFWRDGAWAPVAGVTDCRDLAGQGEQALALTKAGTVKIAGGVAAAAVALPAVGHDDVLVGAYGDQLAVAIGPRIFAADGTNLTPQWGEGSALKARVQALSRDGVGTDGGGAVNGGRFYRLY